jgi:hypothetical protein
MERLFAALQARPWGDIASIVGLLVSLIGFVITIRVAWRSKKAAELAQEEVAKIRSELIRSMTIVDFASAVMAMDEIKRLHRDGAWNILPARYTALRRMLIAIRSANPGLNEVYQTVIQRALQQFRSIEHVVERALAMQQPPADPARLNRIVSDQIDALSEILETMKQDIGR